MTLQVTQETDTAKSMCGPACIEMVFRYWGVDGWDQRRIVAGILELFPDTPRYLKSGILETDPTDLTIYPGTGTITMRRFLGRFGEVENLKVETVDDEARHERDREDMFAHLEACLAAGVPVIVHQYTSRKIHVGHYRVVTGYDAGRQVLQLNDPRPLARGGGRIEQSVEDFLFLWNVDEPWLHYNALVFTPAKREGEGEPPAEEAEKKGPPDETGEP